MKQLHRWFLTLVSGGADVGPVPLSVGAEDGDSQDKVEHD